jgi:hypothetical protein
VDDFDFRIKDVAFEAKVFNKYGNFDWIANRNMKDLGYAYLQYNLLDWVVSITITLKVKLLYIKIHLQKCMFCEGGKFWH